LYRFEYPESLFLPLRSVAALVHTESTLKVIDIGCGTGLVTSSFVRAVPVLLESHLVDVDPEMLAVARSRFENKTYAKSFHCAPAESLPHPDESFDVVLIGSAWHWMKPEQSLREIERVLKPGGIVFIFEYQFPKALNQIELNDWIRIQFNTVWKPQTQVPRGTLKELTSVWRSHDQFSQCAALSLVSERMHDASELAGVIASQSRYQHYEQILPESEQLLERARLQKNLEDRMKPEICSFLYGYEGYVFKKRR